MNEEEDMIRLAQEDISCFEPLYNKYYERIFRFVVRKTDDDHVASDIVSKVFLNAMNALSKYKVTEFGFGSWLYKIASNEVNKHFRVKKHVYLSLEDDKVMQVMTCDEIEDSGEKQRVLTELIKELKDEEIKILELKFFENKNFAEIAYILDKKESSVKMKLYRALDKLKVRFESMRDD
ncbi:MAG: sigma-70 family RNA polymerase sigma factor [Reichenbachiella sp.]